MRESGPSQVPGAVSVNAVSVVGLALVVLFTGMYLRLAFPIGATAVPGILSIPAAAVLLLGARRGWSLNHLIPPCALLIISGIGLFLVVEATGLMHERVKATLLLAVALMAAYAVGRTLRSWKSERIAHVFGVLALVILIGSALETVTPLGGVSDLIRKVLYTGRFVYESNERDLLLHGAVRPKLFTQEPSHVAKFLALSLLCWWAASASRWRHLGLLVGLGLGLVVVRSPSLALAVPLALAGVWARAGAGRRRWTARMVTSVVGALLMVMLLGNWRGLVANIPAGRIREVVTGQDPSTLIRVVAPYRVAADVVRTHPWIGVGIGGKEAAHDRLRAAYVALPGSLHRRAGFRSGSSVGWGNAFAEVPVFFGAVGGAAVLGIVAWLGMAWFSVGPIATLTAFFAVFNADAGFVSYLPWTYWACFLATIASERGGNPGVPANDTGFPEGGG